MLPDDFARSVGEGALAPRAPSTNSVILKGGYALPTLRTASAKDGDTNTLVMPGLDPGIHPSSQEALSEEMDCRVKPGNDS
jgi:hypothetical protein